MINDRDKLKQVIKWHYKCCIYNQPTNFHTLLVGPSGSGKTYSIKKAMAECEKDSRLEVPFIEIDANMVTAEGWRGDSIIDTLGKHACLLGDVKLLERAIIYVDEIDKLTMHDAGSENSKCYKSTQENFLKLLDNDNKITIRGQEISTNKMTFIFSGAFEHLFSSKVSEKVGTGFTSTVERIEKYSTKLDWTDIIESGMVPEFINRINILLQTSPYSKEELTDIAAKSPDMRIISHLLCEDDIVDTYGLAKEAAESDMTKHAGARALTKHLYKHALELAMQKEDEPLGFPSFEDKYEKSREIAND